MVTIWCNGLVMMEAPGDMNQVFSSVKVPSPVACAKESKTKPPYVKYEKDAFACRGFGATFTLITLN
jgi:hypothetical protein